MASVTADAQEVHLAQSQKIPAWNARLQSVLGGPCALNVDFNQLTASTASQPDKFKIIKAVVSTTKALGGLQTITCACEQVVRAFEAAVDDAAVAKDIASQLNTIRIINQLPDTLPENKSLTFGGGIITYAGVFPSPKGTFSKAEIVAFLESKFFVQERSLVNKFTSTALPAAQQRLAALVPGVQLDFDTLAALQQCTEQGKRLPISKTMITNRGITGDINHTLERGVHEVSLGFSKLESAVVGKSSVQVAAKPDAVTFDSPAVLQPLLNAINEAVRASPSNQQLLSSTIQRIQICNAPGADPALRSLQLVDAQGAVLAPSLEPLPPPMTDCRIVYTGCFEAGHKGCYSRSEVLAFLEEHFRVGERAQVEAFLSQNLPLLNERVQKLTTLGVQIEMDWAAIFPPGMPAGAGRLAIANLVCRGGGCNVVVPLVKALEEMVAKAGPPAPSNPVMQLLSQKIMRIMVSTAPADAVSSAKPSLQLQVITGGQDTLVYTAVLAKGLRGCLAVHEAKDQLRALLGVEKPASEKGAQATLNKAGTEFKRLGADVGSKLATLGKWGFGRK